MNIVWAGLIVTAATVLAVVVMLAVRRRAPEGGYYADSDRAAGIFGVLATGFSVLLGFLIFLGFESYDASRVGAETEALTVAQQIQTAQLLPDEVGGQLTGELVCYACEVIHGEWARMEDGMLDDAINPWGAAMFGTLRLTSNFGSAPEEAAYGKWLDQTSAREEARQHRIHGAQGLMPSPLWIALFFISVVVLIYVSGSPTAVSEDGSKASTSAASSGSSPRCCCCSLSSTTRSTVAWVDCNRRRWNAPRC